MSEKIEKIKELYSRLPEGESKEAIWWLLTDHGIMKSVAQSNLDQCDKFSKQVSTLQHSLATAERERDDAIRANHSVSVCKDHTVDITGPGCVVCDLYNTAGERSQLRVKLEAAERELAELRREVLETRKAFADEVIARLDKVEADASERYKTPSFRVIQNVCSDLKWFVGELLKNPTTPHEVSHEPELG